MRIKLVCCAAALAFAATTAQAQYGYPSQPYYPCPPVYIRVAPDMCGPGFYCTNGYTFYGPSYNVYPPFPPVGGIQPPIGCQQQPAALPYNPYTRSPRDYFMWQEAQKLPSTRETRPPFGP
ncbi:MAG TPA: hypothetical protein VE988_03285 [Gemmataceae bacterium]|nr:hypothetical protein [Gemmataceae bacterium]